MQRIRKDLNMESPYAHSIKIANVKKKKKKEEETEPSKPVVNNKIKKGGRIKGKTVEMAGGFSKVDPEEEDLINEMREHTES